MRLILAILIALGLTGPVHADEHELWPDVPKATGEPHPEGNEYWRKNHPRLLKHDRDLTMYQGERQVQASLKQCFDCHAVKDESGQPVTYADERNFCRVCHDFAAVKVDCFMCHRSTPEGVDETALQERADARSLPERITAYLEGFEGAARQTEAER